MIVAIITSMRFKEELLETTRLLSLQGIIVLAPVICTQWEGAYYHEQLSALHRKKLKMCNKALVLNVGGYIGEDGQSEIDFCRKNKIPVNYLENPKYEKNKEYCDAFNINGKDQVKPIENINKSLIELNEFNEFNESTSKND